MTEIVTMKLALAYGAASDATQTKIVTMKLALAYGAASDATQTKIVTMKLALAYGSASDATQTIVSRPANLSVDTTGPTDTGNKDGSSTKTSHRAANTAKDANSSSEASISPTEKKLIIAQANLYIKESQLSQL